MRLLEILEDGPIMLGVGMFVGGVLMAFWRWLYDQEQREREKKKRPKQRFYNLERLNLSWPEYRGFPRKETKHESAR